jgi:hypothetical protein
MQALRFVVGSQKLTSPLLAKNLQPTPHQEIGMARLDGELLDLRASHWPGIPGRCTRHASQHGVGKPARPRLASTPDLIDGLIDHGEGGNSIEKQQLVDGEPQGRQKRRVNGRNRSLRGLLEDPVETAQPAKRADDEFLKEASIPGIESSSTLGKEAICWSS